MLEYRQKCLRGDRREAILDVARELFSKEGYAATSMSHIAAQLGGSKGTLYNYFRSKEELFQAHIQDRCRHFTESMFFPPLQGDNPNILLATLAERILTLLLSDESMDFYRLVITEAPRNPAIGEALYDSGPNSKTSLITRLLERLRNDGHIVTDDCMRASQEFFSLIHGGIPLKRLLNIIPNPSPAEIKLEAAKVTDTFLRAYGPIRPHLGIEADNVGDLELAVVGAKPISRYEKLRGQAGDGLSTDEIMALTRGEGKA